MKLSVSMTDDDLAFLDDYAARHSIASRSGALRDAVRALRQLDLQDAYADAWNETANIPTDEWDPPEPWIPFTETLTADTEADA